MVEILLSKKLPDFYYIRYSGICSTEDDDFFVERSLKPFAGSKAEFTMIIEMAPDFVVTDKDFFGTTEISNENVYKSLKRYITFGHVGIALAFERSYCAMLEKEGVETHTLKGLLEFELKYDIKVNQDFEVILSNIKQ